MNFLLAYIGCDERVCAVHISFDCFIIENIHSSFEPAYYNFHEMRLCQTLLLCWIQNAFLHREHSVGFVSFTGLDFYNLQTFRIVSIFLLCSYIASIWFKTVFPSRYDSKPRYIEFVNDIEIMLACINFINCNSIISYYTNMIRSAHKNSIQYRRNALVTAHKLIS